MAGARRFATNAGYASSSARSNAEAAERRPDRISASCNCAILFSPGVTRACFVEASFEGTGHGSAVNFFRYCERSSTFFRFAWYRKWST